MKSLIASCFVVGLLQFVAAQNNAEVEQPVTDVPFQYNKEDHSYLWGAKEADDILLTEEVIYQNGTKATTAESNFESKSGVIITAIKATPNIKDSIIGTPEIVKGGIGQNEAVVQVNAAVVYGNYFTVEYYGRLVQ